MRLGRLCLCRRRVRGFDDELLDRLGHGGHVVGRGRPGLRLGQRLFATLGTAALTLGAVAFALLAGSFGP